MTDEQKAREYVMGIELKQDIDMNDYVRKDSYIKCYECKGRGRMDSTHPMDQHGASDISHVCYRCKGLGKIKLKELL
ncbi:MAG: hypothetical protein KAS32_01830 [Candidatus Peribacteraceae bacterium]|nr:hypothetical protein [Candidatus Peribacteraceae bacterium]